LFPRDILNEAVKRGGLTAWQLNGRSIIKANQKFMAISHVWSDGTGTRAWDGLKINRCLYHFLERSPENSIAREYGGTRSAFPITKNYAQKPLINMHRNYEKAEITLIHDCFLRNLKWVNNETACFAIAISPWFSRG
jgi:hypothetical protein